MTMTGLDVSRRYWADVVGPLLARRLPHLAPAAARIGGGSEILGLDDDTSRDHDWGLQLTVLVGEPDVARTDALLAAELPESFAGLPTRFAVTHDDRRVHRVRVTTIDGVTSARLGTTIGDEVTAVDWLTMTGQALLEVTGGEVFADPSGELTRVRRVLTRYPDDVLLHVVAAGWLRLAEELPLVGRAGERGDEIGSRAIAGRLCAALMHLGFVLDQRWAPYPKWLGTAFAALPRAAVAVPALTAAVATDSWRVRQEQLSLAAEQLYEVQRAAGLPCVDGRAVEPFFDRPFRTVRPSVVTVLRSAIADPAVRAVPAGIGAVEQWIDNVAVLTDPHRRAAALRACLTRPTPTWTQTPGRSPGPA